MARGLLPLFMGPSEVGATCSSTAGQGVGRIVRWLPPERALVCAICTGWATAQTLELGESKEKDLDSLSSCSSARILSAGLSFLKGMAPRLRLGREE